MPGHFQLPDSRSEAKSAGTACRLHPDVSGKGTASLVRPLPAPAAILEWDLYWMLGITFLLIPFFFRAKPGIRRLGGAAILGSYVAYIASLVIRA